MTNTLSNDSVRAIRRTLNAILRKTNAVNREVAFIADLLDGTGLPPDPVGVAGVSAEAVEPEMAADVASLGRTPKRYEICQVDGEMRLLEYREDGATPFAVPERVYEAYARAVAAGSGKKFDQIHRKAVSEAGETTRDYHGRVLFRFWQLHGLLARSRSRYAVVGAKDSFPARAREAWHALQENSKSPV